MELIMLVTHVIKMFLFIAVQVGLKLLLVVCQIGLILFEMPHSLICFSQFKL